MTYQIGFDNTGLETESQLTTMAERMQERGYDVEVVTRQNTTNGMYGVECPCGEAEWFELLELAA